MNSNVIVRLLAGLFFALAAINFVAAPSSGSMMEPTMRPEIGAQKLGDKLHCADKSYRLKKSVWTWMCDSKNKKRTYGFVHPDFASELYYATGEKCADVRKVWFVFAPNNWAVGVKTKADGNTKALAVDVRKITGGYVDYVCG